ncbi:hypothetical protein MPTK1_Vg00050 [Marchantia polymorpha subsp. ruderalis]|uniref:Uncharacterized protein n=1 Tax=Marchantia polymorpha TaxID=3197 RepID=A0A2R6VWZ3_MARPO|nr:hypothetical protein MARPO_YB0047 [Marchantia polymorpha]BBN20446.1 hypothetical protein Mp_Vg00050 [Marchantia polymorpha subsp. ruderalis]|eukprot:PTQ26106.1 hypothetical protein MARPO_YB0047 [Marchantia polymorpha]
MPLRSPTADHPPLATCARRSPTALSKRSLDNAVGVIGALPLLRQAFASNYFFSSHSNFTRGIEVHIGHIYHLSG